MTLSLDTSVLIELMNGRRAQVREAYQQAKESGEDLLVSSLVVHELLFGPASSGQIAHRREVDMVLATLSVAPFTAADAAAAAEVRAALERQGTRIGSMDMLIAGQAVGRGWTVVTSNVRDFSRVRDLALVDWTAP